jgi:hypothetical protein
MEIQNALEKFQKEPKPKRQIKNGSTTLWPFKGQELTGLILKSVFPSENGHPGKISINKVYNIIKVGKKLLIYKMHNVKQMGAVPT